LDHELSALAAANLESWPPPSTYPDGNSLLCFAGGPAPVAEQPILSDSLFPSALSHSGDAGPLSLLNNTPPFLAGDTTAGMMSMAQSAITTPFSGSASNSSKKRHSPDSSQSDDSSPPDELGGETRAQKRQRNTEAARRYRQRKVDKVTELEEALQAMAKERDDLKLKLARAEAEVDVLRTVLKDR